MKKIMIVALLTIMGIATTTSSFARDFRGGRNFNNNNNGRGGYRNEGSFRRDDHRVMERNRFYGNDRRFEHNSRSFENRSYGGYGYNNYYNNGCRR